MMEDFVQVGGRERLPAHIANLNLPVLLPILLLTAALGLEYRAQLEGITFHAASSPVKP
jgi:hypothetical protein